MSENDLKLYPPSSERLQRLSEIVSGLRDPAGIELSGSELRPELPRAIPQIQNLDGTYVLVGLRFETAAEAAHFANGLEDVVTQSDRDGRYLFFERPPPIIRDEHWNCSGVN